VNSKVIISFLTSVLIHLGLLGSFAFGPILHLDTTINFAEKSSDKISSKTIIRIQHEIKKVTTKTTSQNKAIKKSSPIAKRAETSSTIIEQQAGKKTLMAKYLTQIRKHIENKKTYPKIAQKMKMEGNVKVSFQIQWPNTISNIQLQERSKYQLLNNATVKLIKKLKNLPKIPEQLNQKIIDIVVPINYTAI